MLEKIKYLIRSEKTKNEKILIVYVVFCFFMYLINLTGLIEPSLDARFDYKLQWIVVGFAIIGFHINSIIMHWKDTFFQTIFNLIGNFSLILISFLKNLSLI